MSLRDIAGKDDKIKKVSVFKFEEYPMYYDTNQECVMVSPTPKMRDNMGKRFPIRTCEANKVGQGTDGVTDKLYIDVDKKRYQFDNGVYILKFPSVNHIMIAQQYSTEFDLFESVEKGTDVRTLNSKMNKDWVVIVIEYEPKSDGSLYKETAEIYESNRKKLLAAELDYTRDGLDVDVKFLKEDGYIEDYISYINMKDSHDLLLRISNRKFHIFRIIQSDVWTKRCTIFISSEPLSYKDRLIYLKGDSGTAIKLESHFMKDPFERIILGSLYNKPCYSDDNVKAYDLTTKPYEQNTLKEFVKSTKTFPTSLVSIWWENEDKPIQIKYGGIIPYLDGHDLEIVKYGLEEYNGLYEFTVHVKKKI